MKNRGVGLLFEMDFGKTLTAIAIAGAAFLNGKIKKLLVVAPTSVVSVWPKEFDEYADFPYIVHPMQGTAAKKVEALNTLAMATKMHAKEPLQVAVINYESAWRTNEDKPKESVFDAISKWQPDMIICDESQRIKSNTANQSKAMHKLGDIAKYKLILSGTPIQNSAMDVWSQYRFLDKTIFGENFYSFRARYAVMGGFNGKQVISTRDIDILTEKAHSIAYRVTKDEALDLPEQVFENREIEMTPKERRLYDQIKKECFAEIDGGEMTAAIITTKLLPCIVSDMDYKTQLATMLLENMQRIDLTIWEQAQGFQMMMDLGETAENIAEKTGFSKTTVKRRVKLLELDKDKFKDSVERGATIMDYAELEKVKDIKLRNEVLESIGTSNFNWKLQNAIEKEKCEKNKANLLPLLESFATEVDAPDYSKMKYLSYIQFSNTSNFEKPEDSGDKKYYYTISSYSLNLYVEKDEQQISEPQIDSAEQKRREVRAKLDEISKQAYELRKKFIGDFSAFKSNSKKIMEFAIHSMLNEEAGCYNCEDVIKQLGGDLDEIVQNNVEKVLLNMAYANFGDSEGNIYYDWDNQYDENSELDKLYDILCKFGYQMSDDEKALQNGTHELFVKEYEE